MKMYDLIFSNNRLQRIKRHLLFWAVVYVYQVVRISFLFPQDQIWVKAPWILITGLIWGIFIFNMFFSYTIIYYLIPNFFVKKKYVFFTVGILIIWIVLFGLHLLHNLINQQFIHAVGTSVQQPYIYIKANIIRMFGNPPLICGLLLSLKTIKTWHQKQVQNETLIREKANAELQLLKAQIHPHFLFNTLNNIYSFTLTKSPLAAELVQKLSDMLGYMITDCDHTMVPLEKEIQLIEDYIGLEKVRYGNRLDIQMHVNGDYKNKMIAPLLMIPFVENCFKHGASMMRGKQWMQLSIHVNNNVLYFNLTNSKPLHPVNTKSKNGIGLLNVKKRLGLLYPDKHQLIINVNEGVYNVQLQIELQTQMAAEEKSKLITIPISTYA